MSDSQDFAGKSGGYLFQSIGCLQMGIGLIGKLGFGSVTRKWCGDKSWNSFPPYAFAITYSVSKIKPIKLLL